MNLEEKRKIVLSTQKLLEDKISFQEFCDKIPEDIDEDITRLVDMIEHLPSEKGIFGGDNKKNYDQHVKEIGKLIDEILK